ncbi:MAG: phospho-N-acetylmuramoyl-pentapeptide-transferase, partial [Bacteroidales bacterium]|nr:phospho-N-acetylmuramoyl-pentapeptide-transferase [Bacteroidales bacterium]
MLIYLFEYLDEIGFPGAGVFQYISFRSASAVITSLIISMLFGKRIINMLRRKQIGESIRDLGLEGQASKQGTPTMGGIIILASILIPTLMFADLGNTYVLLMILTTVWLGLVGFVDDYIKVFRKNKKGLTGKFKIMGQVLLGI